MSDLFERAKRAVKIEDIAARVTKLRGVGNDRRGACPLCGKGKESGAFSVLVAKQSFACFVCGEHGDVIELYRLLKRLTPYEAALELAGPDVGEVKARVEPQARAMAGPDASVARKLARAAETWSRARPFAGSLAQTYLLARGIDPEVVAAVDGLRFHPDAQHSWREADRRWIAAPAMVAQAMTPGGWTGGVHATFLAADGLAKAAFEKPKLMIGPQMMETPLGVVRGGAMLIAGDADLDLVVAEGIETALSLASWLKACGRWPLKVCAALSLNRLMGGVLRDKEGRIDVWKPAPDPERPAFTWPAYGEGRRCWIGIDRDMSALPVKGRNGRGKPVEIILDGEARALLSAKMAKAAWKSAGWDRVTPMFPLAGDDWNDAIRRLGRAA